MYTLLNTEPHFLRLCLLLWEALTVPSITPDFILLLSGSAFNFIMIVYAKNDTLVNGRMYVDKPSFRRPDSFISFDNHHSLPIYIVLLKKCSLLVVLVGFCFKQRLSYPLLSDPPFFYLVTMFSVKGNTSIFEKLFYLEFWILVF